MGGIALLAREAGFEVSGSDTNVYPPMSVQLEKQGIKLMHGYDPKHLSVKPDEVVVGNVMSRGNPMIEAVLDQGLVYTSGPEWLARNILRDRWVLAVSGTHGKTTTSSMLAWILEYVGKAPGFLIGGVPENFGVSARLGLKPFFVVEADEYDTAFFDKRSKFVHYRPKTLIVNNLEYDHADIFANLGEIKRQFHHLLRTVPSNGRVVINGEDANIPDLLTLGCWTPVQQYSSSADADVEWSVNAIAPDGSSFQVVHKGKVCGTVTWPLLGKHNVQNGLAAIAAAEHAGVAPSSAIDALNSFKNVKRRLELKGEVRGIKVYDDFAHHPTAIATTLEGLRQRVGAARIFALLEPRSNTMRMGVHKQELVESLHAADQVLVYAPANIGWNVNEIFSGRKNTQVCDNLDHLVRSVVQETRSGDHVLVMSNGAFGGIHQKLMDALKE